MKRQMNFRRVLAGTNIVEMVVVVDNRDEAATASD
jgi:hypothetical protein